MVKIVATRQNKALSSDILLNFYVKVCSFEKNVLKTHFKVGESLWIAE